MNKTLRILSAFILTVCLTSCWAPENFTATLNVDKNANYEFHYDGVIAFGPALGEITQRGQLSEKGQSEMKKAEAYLQTEPGFSKANYIGDGRFQVVYDAKGVIRDQQQLFLGLVGFTRNQQGQVIIRGVTISDDGRRQLAAVNLKLDGQLKINTELPMAQHNATSEPKLSFGSKGGGLIGSYEWHVTLEQRQSEFAAESKDLEFDPAMERIDVVRGNAGRLCWRATCRGILELADREAVAPEKETSPALTALRDAQCQEKLMAA